MTTIPVTTFGQVRIAGNAAVHKASWDTDRPNTVATFCGAETRFSNTRRLVVTTDAATCKRCSR